MLAAEVRNEQIRTLYSQSVFALLANAANAVIVGALLAKSGAPLLLPWAGLLVATTLARLELRRRYWKARPGPTEAPRWGARHVLGAGVTGALWGAGAVLFFDSAGPLSELLLTFTVGGMCAGVAGTLACYMPAFWGYTLAALPPLAVRIFWEADPLHLAMGVMMVIYCVALAAVARASNRMMTEAFRLRFENQALAERLSKAQHTLEETNHTLAERVADRSAALERQAEALQSAQRMESVGRLAGGIAHDFNNILTVVLGHASQLLDWGELDRAAQSSLEEVRAAATRGAELVRQLLAFSRRQKLVSHVFDLNQVVADAERLLVRVLGEQVQLRLELGPGPLLVRADASQIEQILFNLVTNARDAMPAGGVVTIGTAAGAAEEDAARAGGSFVLLTVSDTGTGMDPETQRRAFEPFFTTKDVGRGTGLGLATVYGIVEQSGGRVAVESRLGEGSRFEVYLPRILEEAGAPAGALPGAAAPPTSATILLAEDEPGVRSVIERSLRRAGHTVLAAGTGEELLALAAQHPGRIDLLVTDVVMPGMGGLEVAKRLAALIPGLPVLFLSGYSADHALPVGEGGGTAFLGKPFTPDALTRKVAELLNAPAAAAAATAAAEPAPRPARPA